MRRRRAEKRIITPDPKFKNLLVSRLINIIMQRGKKSVAENIVYQALDRASRTIPQKDPIELLMKAIENVRPFLQLKSRRVGGATYQIPVEVSSDKGTSLAMRWIRNAAKMRKGKSMEERLSDELCEAYGGQGAAVKRKEEIHKMAEANRAFSHYRW